MSTRHLLLIGLTLGLVHCGGGNGPSDTGFCRALGGGGSTVATNPAPGASFADPDNAFDGDLDSAATLSSLTGTGASSIRGTAQAGVVAAQGLIAGALINTSDLDNNLQVTITTYLDGVQQDTGPAVSTENNDSYQFLGISTTRAFDAIQATFTLAGGSSTVTLYELCVTSF